MKKKTVLFLVLMLLFLMLLTNGLQGEEKTGTTPGFIVGENYLKMTEENKIYYVMGLMDMFWTSTWNYDREIFPDIEEATKRMTPEQISAILDKYLEEHPEEWHYNTANLLAHAIMDIVNEK